MTKKGGGGGIQIWVFWRERSQQLWSSRRHSLLQRTLIWNLLSSAFLIATPRTVPGTDLFWTWVQLNNKLSLRMCLRISMCRCFISSICFHVYAFKRAVLMCSSDAAKQRRKPNRGLAFPCSICSEPNIWYKLSSLILRWREPFFLFCFRKENWAQEILHN